MDTHRFYDLAFYVPPDSPLLDEYLAALQHMGIRQIGTDGLRDWRDEALTARIAKTIHNREMQVIAAHATRGLVGARGSIDTDLADNRRIIDHAAEWGARDTVWHFRWFCGPTAADNWAKAEVMESTPVEQIDQRMAEVLPATCAYAAERGMEVSLENLPLYKWASNPGQLLEFIRGQNLPNLGFILDSGHAWASGLDPAEAIRAAGPLLRDTHFHDCIGPRGWTEARAYRGEDNASRDLHAIVGLGTINWVAVVRALWAINFAGPVVFEGPQIKGHPDKSVAQWARCVDLTIRMWRAFEDAAAYWPNPAEEAG